MQGYNAQAVTNEQHIILAAEIETVGADFAQGKSATASVPLTPTG